MNRVEKINYIKWYLQKFGTRDNECFGLDIDIDGVEYIIRMQYNYAEEGYELSPFNWCNRYTSKLIAKDSIEDKTDNELDSIISVLKSLKQYY